jgi:hypothetical protein
MRNHYVYYSFENWGRGYIGSRSCDCLPEEDTAYFGSYSDKNFKPAQKIILRSDYKTREEAIADEITLHEFYDVGRNPQFANRAKQTSTKFDTTGKTLSEETRIALKEAFTGEKNHRFGKKVSEATRQKISSSLVGRRLSEETRQKLIKLHTGRKRSEETRRKISESLKGKKYNDEKRRKISDTLKGRKYWVNKEGEIRNQVDSPGAEWKNGRKWRG